ncbi:MAG: SGNH/GDSL hydrolase family protein [Actinomycetota bacterium]|nr:SGNH/GDSL hydrolase family protein [Actinomycetota bacterium]
MKRVPLWAWCAIGLVVLVVLITLVNVNTSASDAEVTAATETTTETTAAGDTEAEVTMVTAGFIEDAAANPAKPKTIVLLGDSTGAEPDQWAPALGTAIGQTYDRGVATKYWDTTTGEYGPMIGLNAGTNGPVGFWNGTARGESVDYTIANLDGMIRPEVTPDLILLNFGAAQGAETPLAEQVQPLIDRLEATYPDADIAVITQNPQPGVDSAAQVSEYAKAMEAEGIQVISVYDAFPSDTAGLAATVTATGAPSAQGQELWTTTVLAAFGLSAP